MTGESIREGSEADDGLEGVIFLPIGRRSVFRVRYERKSSRAPAPDIFPARSKSKQKQKRRNEIFIGTFADKITKTLPVY